MNLNLFVTTLLRAMLIVSGAGQMEDLTEDEKQIFEHYAAHPLPVNTSDVRSLRESGLFSEFRAASLADYISRNGPVLSVRELATVDGFNQEIAEALSWFISFDTASLREDRRTVCDSRFQAGASLLQKQSWSWLSNARLQKGQDYFVNAGVAGQCLPSGQNIPSISALTISSSLNFPRAGLKLYLGDFNARFGQGAACWNSLLIKSYTSVNSLILKPSGLAESRSDKGNYAKTGLGARFSFGRCELSLALTLPGFKTALLTSINGNPKGGTGFEPLLNFNWWGRHCSLGLTSVVTILPSASASVISTAVSADFRTCLRGVDLAGEVALMVKTHSSHPVVEPAARLACTVPAGEWFKAGTCLIYTKTRHTASLIFEARTPKQHSFALGACFTNSHSSSGTSRQTARFDATASFRWAQVWAWDLRLKENLDFACPQQLVSTLRTDLAASWASAWTTSLTAACSKSSKWGLAIYLEQSLRSASSVSAHLRAGIFSIDDWDGRIYFYEYDLPGRFTVPALYGRGYWISAHLGAKIARCFRLDFRLSYKDYAFMPPDVRKDPALEARLGFSTNF